MCRQMETTYMHTPESQHHLHVQGERSTHLDANGKIKSMHTQPHSTKILSWPLTPRHAISKGPEVSASELKTAHAPCPGL